MTKMFFKPWNPSQESANMVTLANDIIEEYETQGYQLTLRQLYYQFVARDIIENSERSYKNLGTLITKGRMSGQISWTAIEDRNREHHSFWFEEDDSNVVSELYRYIRFDQWDRQPVYMEVWVEKEALGNVVSRACSPYLVPYMSCKGYLSASEAWRAGQRFAKNLALGKHCVLIHLGDHDPSGIDMTRDNEDRVSLFSGFEGVDGAKVEVVRIALNRDQIDEFHPPPNPAKVTDSRAKEYIKKHGHTSWELDALNPKTLNNLIQNEIRTYIDYDIWDSVREEEKSVERRLLALAEKWPEIRSSL